MTALAITEAEIAAECPAAVVTRRAGLPARADEVLGRGSRTHLPCLRRSGGELMTVVAVESLARAVFRVTERVTKSARVRACGPIRLLVMTDATRRDLAASV